MPSSAHWRGNPLSALIFDLDGTLIESLGDLRHALNSALTVRGLRHLNDSAVAKMVGDGIPKLVERGLAATGGDTSQSELNLAVADFMMAYKRRPVEESYLYPGVVETLETLHTAGLKMGICTNKSKEMSALVLQRLDISHYFACIIGGDSLPQRKPAPEPVLACLSALKVQKQEALFVGDSKNDVLAAKACDLPILLVPSGYGPARPEDLEADLVIASFADLKTRLFQ
ncbi:MAG: phosphoglycolate phosphatase [Kiloniellales bacterium]|nr:phosphoglycolate phosphatase [Kiloniellales bacterium]